jgi:plasmid stability protein
MSEGRSLPFSRPSRFQKFLHRMKRMNTNKKQGYHSRPFAPIVLDLPEEMYRRLEDQARRAGKPPETFTREILESALQSQERQPKTTREILEVAGRVRPLSETLRRRIIPGVTLDEVRLAMQQVESPSLSEIVLEQRGPKS